ncbi:AAA family ATPase [Vibrio genomosp. F6]|uniref:AAA family ATPase n=1 Tax=Vibrio genomosp. F6 TaxID=723172 RepID=UPI0014824995|nr:AAA family ATPase [Vibrio genomosp. F6]
MDVTKLEVEKLNGIFNYDISFSDNKLILVGENGTGKSTILSILNFILTCQWHKLEEIKFKSIKISFTDHYFEFTSRQVKEFCLFESNPKSRTEHFVQRALRQLDINLEDAYSEKMSVGELADYISDNTPIKISPLGVKKALSNMFDNYSVSSNNVITDLNKFIRKNFGFPIIYLPTYRRIERELNSILPNLDEYGNKEKVYHRYYNKSPKQSGQIELAEFGMSDVKKIIGNELERLEQSFRNGMKQLMADYLQDILLHNHADVSSDVLDDIDTELLEKLLLRIDSDTLSEEIKFSIKNNILDIGKDERQQLTDSEKVILYFITKLMWFHDEQTRAEKKIESFIGICNKYLVRKKITFNSFDFEVKINHVDNDNIIISKNEIPFDSLSSGEKQIVSLFAHLILSNQKEFIIIIDEPELSLSVDWQRTFLEDINYSGNCLGMFAVTHSPFVFDNSLDLYARSVNEFMEIA